MSAVAVRAALKALAEPDRAVQQRRFFKTGPGEYGAGDRFLGVTVPQQRAVARRHRSLPLSEAGTLLDSPLHEVRLTALFILVERFQRQAEEREAVIRLYLARLDRVNNWDLVDSSAPHLLGPWLEDRDRGLLYELAASPSVWRRRVAMLACFHFIRRQDYTDALALAESLLGDGHDLIHKAVGWMLREIGKRDGEAAAVFLRRHCRAMPRTMLRYAIERLPADEREHYLRGG